MKLMNKWCARGLLTGIAGFTGFLAVCTVLSYGILHYPAISYVVLGLGGVAFGAYMIASAIFGEE